MGTKCEILFRGYLLEVYLAERGSMCSSLGASFTMASTGDSTIKNQLFYMQCVCSLLTEYIERLILFSSSRVDPFVKVVRNDNKLYDKQTNNAVKKITSCVQTSGFFKVFFILFRRIQSREIKLSLDTSSN